MPIRVMPASIIPERYVYRVLEARGAARCALISCVIRRNVKRKLKPIDRVMARPDNYVRFASPFRRTGARTYLHIGRVKSLQRELRARRVFLIGARGGGAGGAERPVSGTARFISRIRDNLRGKLFARSKLLVGNRVVRVNI